VNTPEIQELSPKRRRTWAQRFVLVFNTSVAAACLIAAVVIYYGSEKANDRKVVSIIGGATALTLPQAPIAGPQGDVVDLTAQNFLITGSDNGACVDPDSPYAGAFGDRTGFGERADTIMVLRLDPTTKAAAVLSFPRDLWVRLGGKTTKGRINSAFNRDDPNRLIVTIFDNFGIKIDHYVNIDFCAFKQIVDAVGGVKVPFSTPIKDENTGLLIETAGCHNFGGEEGLAYVRSRKLRYFDESKKAWVTDGNADRGRISRQQDFLRRAIQKAIDRGSGSPRIAKQLIDAGIEHVILDSELTAGKILELALSMKDLDPATMQTYQVEGEGANVGGQSVILPTLDTEIMSAILAVFRGEAFLSAAPAEPTTIPGAAPSTTPGAAPVTEAPPADSTPGELVESNAVGILPADDPTCR
jgi:LCP family protein required for cell wall assembly